MATVSADDFASLQRQHETMQQQQQQQQQIADAQIKEFVAQINGQQIKIATLEETIKSNMSMVERLIQAKHCTP